MYDKLVSIIIPTYNRADLIGETIQSVIDQTYTNWELIIVDDGSDDNTGEVIRNFNQINIQYYKIEHSGNLGKVRNIGMKAAKGKCIAFLDSDDIWLPQKLECQLTLLDQYPNTSFVFGHAEQFGPGAISPPELENLFVGNIFEAQLLEERFVIYPSTFLFKIETINKVGYLSERWTGGGDVDFFYRIGYHYPCIFTNERLVKMRKHKKSTSQQLGDITYAELLEMLNIFYKDKWLTKNQWNQLVSKIRYRMGLDRLERNEPINALINFMQYVKLGPFHWRRWARVFKSLGSSLFGSIIPSRKK
jgi:glycosyltransferase involved in cell wall biosynthesis